ncbi:MAG: hypothetical protein PHR29_03200 [Acholeplasmataceae bacterium]|nr:hypothetical protein [Acholeplasmataceae bacterium]
MSCKDYVELKPGMEVLITDPIHGLSNEKAVVKKLEAVYYVENANIGIDIVFDVDGREYSVYYPKKISITIKQCRKLNVKDLKVGDVIERDNQRGFVKSKYDDEVGVIWFNTVDTHCYITCYCKEIKDVEVVGHIDLWNL